MWVSKLEVDDGKDDGRVETHRDVRARSRVRKSFDDVESGKHRCSVERGCDLTGSTTDTFDHFAFEDFPALVEAVLFGAIADDAVEADDLVRRENDTVELLRTDVDVLSAELLVSSARKVRLELADDRVDVDRADVIRGHAGRDLRERNEDALLFRMERRHLNCSHASVDIEVPTVAFGCDGSSVEIEARRDGCRISFFFERKELLDDDRPIDRGLERDVDEPGARRFGEPRAFEDILGVAECACPRHDSIHVDAHAEVAQLRSKEDVIVSNGNVDLAIQKRVRVRADERPEI